METNKGTHDMCIRCNIMPDDLGILILKKLSAHKPDISDRSNVLKLKALIPASLLSFIPVACNTYCIIASCRTSDITWVTSKALIRQRVGDAPLTFTSFSAFYFYYFFYKGESFYLKCGSNQLSSHE